ncbi:serine/threonine-protein kinase [uncultured Microbacterium sp.]|uniref:non-specific serine/threonine protein kinase n=1 Tax=uncultured Microbacterium sp. TaxID=191216 RepID=A0A1Y5P357_9MICO|nr:serine/threonine-protein kinase [uncultured Microbacterium sp.]SBS73102.1 Serine/threonine protein kinase-related protein [uncultured Microbacterium sp.]
MSTKRPPAPPPSLPGFTYVELLGSGGFADVYLYEQQLPRRRVAVKVLLPDRMAGASAEQFAAEANVMALLSTHPAIVTIYQAGVSEDGRPYLVMEYCPRPNLQVRSRAAAFSVAEALRVGVQVAAAVETAHRAGILHRDIKPANILVTEYNRPALTDFGIATTAEAADSSAGMSIPWSPPETFADAPESGVRSDVYALGATVYTLLAGHSPFEVPGGRNGGADLIRRIESEPLARLDRADVPESLQVALERSMAKRPGDRYDTAVAFARALQRVQIELAHSVTPIDILDDSPVDDEDDEDDGELTRVRGIVSIEPQTSPAAGQTRQRETAAFAPTAGSAPAETTVEATVLRTPTPVATIEDVSSTVRRAPAPALEHTTVPDPAAPAAPAVPARARSRRGLWVGVGIGVTAALIVGGVALASALTPAPDPLPSPSGSVAPQDPIDGFVPPPADVVGDAADGQVRFTWTNPDPEEGDTFAWYPYTLEGNGTTTSTAETTVTLPADPSGKTCIAVQLVRANGTTGDETRKCAP